MAEDHGIQSPEPMGYGKGWRLTRQMYSNYFMLPFLLMGILLIILPVIGLTVLSAVEVSFPPGYLLLYAGLPFLLGVMSLFLWLGVRGGGGCGAGSRGIWFIWEQGGKKHFASGNRSCRNCRSLQKEKKHVFMMK